MRLPGHAPWKPASRPSLLVFTDMKKMNLPLPWSHDITPMTHAPQRISALEQDLAFLQEAIALSWQAQAAGNPPFGALLVGAQGQVLAQALNHQITSGDCTSHAELNLIAEAGPRLTADQWQDTTLYASAEPCAMCAGAIGWSGISRVVFALSESEVAGLLDGPDRSAGFDLPCRDVFARGFRDIDVTGPVPALREKAAEPLTMFIRRMQAAVIDRQASPTQVGP